MRKIIILFAMLLGFGLALPALAESAGDLDKDAQHSLDRLYKTHHSARSVIDKAAGTLVFPHILKGGVGVGAEYGEGALFEHGKITGHYNIVSGSVGFQLGAQKFSNIICFMDAEALNKFKNSDGWKAGVDGSIVIAESGKSGELDTQKLNNPIVAFILGEKGLMYNATLEGSKITHLKK